ncbi:MAG: hypothetical protein HDT28_01310 [Clostridiales bacterium]|nr:hypothetical protein [Clostridiales bacterium]
MAIVNFLQAGKENSQNKVLHILNEQQSGNPILFFIFVHNGKSGFPIVPKVSFSKSTDFGKTLYLLVIAVRFPKYFSASWLQN